MNKGYQLPHMQGEPGGHGGGGQRQHGARREEHHGRRRLADQPLNLSPTILYEQLHVGQEENPMYNVHCSSLSGGTLEGTLPRHSL